MIAFYECVFRLRSGGVEFNFCTPDFRIQTVSLYFLLILLSITRR